MGAVESNLNEKQREKLTKEIRQIKTFVQLNHWIITNHDLCLREYLELGEAKYRGAHGVVWWHAQMGEKIPYDTLLHWLSTNPDKEINMKHVDHLFDAGDYEVTLCGDQIGIRYLLENLFDYHLKVVLGFEIPLEFVPSDLIEKAKILNEASAKFDLYDQSGEEEEEPDHSNEMENDTL
jgi:hypothetical protein